MNIIEVKNMYFKFPDEKKKGSKARRLLSSLKKNKPTLKNSFLLSDVSLAVKTGDIIGVVGRNGAGKSTLLKVLAGIYPPDHGEISVKGKLSPVLALGNGFKPELSGLDNIYLNGLILGLTKKQIDDRLETIISFSELNDFIHAPVKNYSSGMCSRLGFSIALHTHPDILIIDEVLSVGDAHFNKKAKAKMQEFMQQARAIIICTHNANFVKKFCTKALWLEAGTIKMFGESKEVMEAYGN